MADALLDVARRVEHLAVRPEGARVHAEERELADVRVRDRLEHEGGQRRLRVGRARHGRLRLRVDRLHRALVGRRRELLEDQVEQRRHADAARGRGGEHGHERAGQHRLAQRLEHLRLADRAFLEVLGEEVVVGLGGRLRELLPVRLGRVHHLARDVGLLDLAVGGDEGLHGDQVDDAGEAGLAPDRHLEGGEASLEALLQRLEGADEVGALAVEAIDDDHARQPVLVGELPHLLRLHLHARHRVDHHDGGARHAEPRAGVGDEVAVSGGVDEVEAMALVVAEGHRGVQGNLALDLVGIEIGGGGAVVDLAEARGRAGGEEDRLDERRLAHAAVAHERDVANLGDVQSHACPPLVRLAHRVRRTQEEGRCAPMLPQRDGALQRAGYRRCGDGQGRAARGRRGRATRVGRPCSRGRRCPRPRPRCGRRP